MRVLVTGGAGYIGSHVLVELLNAGHQVHVLDNLSHGHREALRRVGTLTGGEIPLTEVDIRDETGVYTAVSAFHPDACIHLAGLKSPTESLAVPDLYHSVNVTGSQVLFDCLDRAGCLRMVFSSSAAVYGPPVHLPVDESHPTHPSTPYGASKLAVEHALHSRFETAPDRAIAILRYFNPVGAHPSANIGEHPSGPPANLMPILLEAALGKRSHVRIFGTDYPTADGTGLRDYLHITDLARAHLAALEWTADGSAIGTFNLGTGEGVSVRRMIRTFQQVTGRRIPVMEGPRREGDVSANFANPGHANAVLGWTASLSLEEACGSAWAWAQLNPEGYRKPGRAAPSR